MNAGILSPVKSENSLKDERYCAKPFPDYRFVPGQTPHPTRDPQGHSYGIEEPELKTFDPHRWSDCKPYLYGVDLFNHRYWWEAHEAWEHIWKSAGRHTRTGLFLQGLIQISVAMLKTEQDFNNAAARLLRAGVTKLTTANGSYLGIDVITLVTDTRAHILGERSSTPVIRLIHGD